MELRNCTPHPLNIHLPDGSVRSLPPSGISPRVATVTSPAEPVDDVPVVTSRLGEVTGLPEPEAGVFLVVSQIVAGASGRPDLLFPGELVRDEAGRPVGCRGLARR